MEASDATQTPDAVQAAVDAMQGAAAAVELTVGGGPGAVLPQTVFPRKSVERRVLGHICDEVDETAYGPRNTLAALTRGLTIDRHTTNPQDPECDRFDIDGATLEQQVQGVLDYLTRLVDAGLAEQHEDGSYHVTDAGRAELQS